MRKKRAILTARRVPFRVSAVLALLFCASAFAKPENILRVRTFGEPATLDWNRASTPVEATLIRNLQEGLVGIGSGLKVVPATAKRWEISPDGKTYTFFLRKDVSWSDGKPLIAAQFVDSWERLLNPATKANTAYLLFDIEGAEDYNSGKTADFSLVGVHALDDRTLQVRLRASVPYWIWLPTFWATFPIRKDLIARHGANWDKPGKLVSLGPYLLASHEPGKRVTMDRNPRYYGKRGNIGQIHAYLISDDKLAAQKFEAGELDFVTRISSADVKRFGNKPELRRWPELRTAHLDLNPNLPPTDNVLLRQAIFRAIDRRKISALVSGAYQTATSFVPPGLLAHDEKAGLGYDPARAKALYKKSGMPPGPIELATPAFDDFILIGDFLKTELKKNLGLELKISAFEPKRFYSSAVNFGGYHIILTHWTADYPDPDNFFSIFSSRAGNNRVGWKNAQFDDWILEARGLTASKARLALYSKAQRLLMDEQAIAHALYYGTNHALIRQSIRGFEPTPTNSYLFKDFSFERAARKGPAKP